MKLGSARAWGIYLVFIGLMMYGDTLAVVPSVMPTNLPKALYGIAVPIAVIVGGVLLIMRSRRKKPDSD
jgi:hydrogenase/urease accessory protein HupE